MIFVRQGNIALEIFNVSFDTPFVIQSFFIQYVAGVLALRVESNVSEFFGVEKEGYQLKQSFCVGSFQRYSSRLFGLGYPVV